MSAQFALFNTKICNVWTPTGGLINFKNELRIYVNNKLKIESLWRKL